MSSPDFWKLVLVAVVVGGHQIYGVKIENTDTKRYLE